MLIGARFEDGEQMSDAELRDQLITLLLAGHETTATGARLDLRPALRNPRAAGAPAAEVAAGERRRTCARRSPIAAAAPGDPDRRPRLAEPLEIDGYYAARRAPTSARRSISPTRAPTSIPTRRASNRSASSTGGPTPTPGSRSAAACAAALAPASPSSRCGSCCARSSAAAALRAGERSSRRG